MSKESRAALEASEPRREQYADEQAFLEARSRWMGSVGKILALTRPSRERRGR